MIVGKIPHASGYIALLLYKLSLAFDEEANVMDQKFKINRDFTVAESPIEFSVIERKQGMDRNV